MSVKSAVDYYDTGNIRVGDIVIINDSNPQSCEGDRIVEPYTRLRVRALDMEQYSDRGEIRVRLETECDEIPLAHLVDLLNMQGEPLIHKVENWLKATETAYCLALKKSKVFGKFNPKQLVNTVILFCVLFLIVAICLVMRMESTSVPATSEIGLRIVLGSVVGTVGGTTLASILISRINAMEDARKRAVELGEQLRLYRQANLKCADTTAFTAKIDSQQGIA